MAEDVETNDVQSEDVTAAVTEQVDEPELDLPATNGPEPEETATATEQAATTEQAVAEEPSQAAATEQAVAPLTTTKPTGTDKAAATRVAPAPPTATKPPKKPVLLPGTGSLVKGIGDDFEDENWKWNYNHPKSSEEQDKRMRSPMGRSVNGRWF